MEKIKNFFLWLLGPFGPSPNYNDPSGYMPDLPLTKTSGPQCPVISMKEFKEKRK